MGEKLLTDSYRDLEKQEKIQYICEQLHLKENMLVGTIKGYGDDPRFYYLEKLINPYTGEEVSEAIIQFKEWEKSVYLSNQLVKDYHLQENQTLLFKFEPFEDAGKIESGELLMLNRESVIPIERAEDVLRELEISESEMMVAILDKEMETLASVPNYYRAYIMSRLTEQAYVLHDKYHEEKAKISKLEDQLNKKRALISKEEQAVNHKLKDLAAFEESLNKREQEVSGIEDQLANIGFSFQKQKQDVREPLSKSEFPEDEKIFITKLQEQIARRGFYYEADKLRQFYTVLKTNQFLILNGPSGTGKTSLVTEFAAVTNSHAKIIPVQPSWTDKQDLLGFYNPLEKQYIPSLFLDALIEAKQYKDQLYLICLDELNLAQIEYYFADILSVREQANAPIELYSNYEYEENLKEIEWFVQKALPFADQEKFTQSIEDTLQVDTMEQFRYTQRFRNLQRFNWQLEIPENVRFIGTMNIDGTVRPLSPKVIDRSFIITLLKQRPEVEMPEKKEIYPILFGDFRKFAKIEDNGAIKAQLLEKLTEFLDTTGASFNDRVEKHLDDYIAYSLALNIEQKKIMDELIALKLLPRINAMIDEDAAFVGEFLIVLMTLVGENAESVKKLKTMIEKMQKTRVLSYWG